MQFPASANAPPIRPFPTIAAKGDVVIVPSASSLLLLPMPRDSSHPCFRSHLVADLDPIPRLLLLLLLLVVVVDDEDVDVDNHGVEEEKPCDPEITEPPMIA